MSERGGGGGREREGLRARGAPPTAATRPPTPHPSYAETVVLRMLYAMDRGGGGKLRAADLRRGGLLAALAALDAEDDVNRVTAYFSYEHFYVIYCKFWELDADHDFLLSKVGGEGRGGGGDQHDGGRRDARTPWNATPTLVTTLDPPHPPARTTCCGTATTA